MDSAQLEKYSSAITLSDMEVFIFPELAYSLVLANIMSPIIWQWRELDCFKKLEGKSSYKRLMRLKQFIMDEFDFNLDLQTWGLTNKQTEIRRFESILSPAEIAQSNALFGYEGDKYYFDVDIRRHFGLDAYDSDIIPYWKTETVEAMNAFRRKAGYGKSAGECVSLSTLYAAAAYVVCDIPLDDIYMILTPLHSQNFIDIQDGVLTNNRRLVTKTMWFNGTAISNKAQRALRNERVTIVAHPSGYIHFLYKDATLSKERYKHFGNRLGTYLSAELDCTMVANFLRCNENYQRYFQFCCDCHGNARFLRAETLFRYEDNSHYLVGQDKCDKLLEEVAEEDFAPYAFPDRVRCEQLSGFLSKTRCDLRDSQGRAMMREFIAPFVPDADKFVAGLADFVHTEAKLPDADKNYINVTPIEIPVGWSRQEIIDYLQVKRRANKTADLAFYAFRDMQSCDWLPFVKAAVERNPVCLETTREMTIEQAYQWLNEMPNDSIYDGSRLAQPDELANYGTGDGLEKAFLLANVIRRKNPGSDIEIIVDKNNIVLKGAGEFQFSSIKALAKHIHITSAGAIKIVE
jgi:hypothetical protein